MGVLLIFCGWAQPDPSEAVLLFRMGAYPEAQVAFERLYRQTKDRLWASYALECLLRQNKLREAERWLTQEQKSQRRSEAWLKAWHGRLALAKGDSTYKDWLALLALPELPSQLYEDLAEVSERVWNAYEWQLRFLEEAQKRSPNPAVYAPLFVRAYEAQGAFAKAWPMWLLTWQGGLISTDSLLRVLARYILDLKLPLDTLELPLLRLYQNQSPPPAYNQLLVRFYLSAGDYEEAFRQARAFYKQTGNCEALYEVAFSAEADASLSTAYRAYEALLLTGETCPYYQEALKRYLALEALVHKPTSTLQKVDSLLRARPGNPALVLEKAHWLLALGQASAVPPLLDTLETPTAGLTAQKYFQLAEAALLSENPTQARLYLLEVESRLPESAWLSTAYYKLAELAFFQGEFELAQTRLRLLKNNTQDDLANDAIELFWLIQDNLKPDTLTEPLRLFALALLSERQQKLNKAWALADSLEKNWKGHVITDDVYWLKSRLALSAQDTAQAKLYLTLLADYPDPESLYRDEALYTLARLSLPEKAIYYYERLLREVPNSLYARLAQHALNELVR